MKNNEIIIAFSINDSKNIYFEWDNKMRKMIMLVCVLSWGVCVCGMDAPRQLFWDLDPAVETRHNVLEWHSQLILAVLFNKEDALSDLLKKAGDDAQALVSSHWSQYGSILEAAYIESKEEIKQTIFPYINDTCMMNCFNRRRAMINEMWHKNKVQGAEVHKSPGGEAIVRDLHLKDPNRFLLSEDECRKLGITKCMNN